MKINKIFNNKYIRIDPSKNIKPLYYIKNIIIFLIPSIYFQKKLTTLLNNTNYSKEVTERINYYNKINSSFSLTNANSIQNFRKEKKKVYFFDLYKYLTYYNPKLNFLYLFGDIISVPNEPTLLKSRPIHGDNKNSIIMKLDKVRHFIFLNDKITFKEKKNLLVWRGKAHQTHRQYFLNKFYTNPLCDVGQIIKKEDKGTVQWIKPKMSIKEHLNYKFILCIEGNDVASNLKWVMSSNSLAFMVAPKYETWFMEGKLIPNYHYVLLKDDYSDLEEKINYYSTHTDKAEKIINNAHIYIEQFKNIEQEDFISLMVVDKYFNYSSEFKKTT